MRREEEVKSNNGGDAKNEIERYFAHTMNEGGRTNSGAGKGKEKQQNNRA